MFRLIKNIIPYQLRSRQSVFTDSFGRLNVSVFKELQGPEAIEWFPSYLCNSKCQYCGGYDNETISSFGKTVPFKNIAKWVELSGKSGTTMWNVGGRGGEPLLYPDLIDVLEIIKLYKMRGILITNGLLLNAFFLTRMVKAKWDILRISLDSHGSEIHDEIRGIKGNFKIIDMALSLLKKIKRENSSVYPYIICCPVITNKNYKYIIEYFEYCGEMEVNEIQFMPLISVHDRAGKLSLSDEQRNEFIVLLERIRREDRVKHNTEFIISFYKDSNKIMNQKLNAKGSPSNKLYCIHLWKTLVISEDGYLSPCSLIKDKLCKIKDSYLEAWNSQAMNDLRKKVLRGQVINSACKDCCGPLRNETDDFNQYLLKHKNEIS
jgi:MoaA/NifB/PqqE/SkfB family radical SAM enzyme